MRKSRFTETQIIGILKAVEAGRLVKDVCREHSVSEATYSLNGMTPVEYRLFHQPQNYSNTWH